MGMKGKPAQKAIDYRISLVAMIKAYYHPKSMPMLHQKKIKHLESICDKLNIDYKKIKSEYYDPPVIRQRFKGGVIRS